MPPSAMSNVEHFINVSRNVLRLQDEHGLTIAQINGQRKLGGPPPGWVGPPPGPECEVFVGKIPRDLFEDTLYNIFSKVGSIYEIRLMMNFSGTNRGFCFIMYSCPEEAQRAIIELNNYEIVPGRCIGVVASVNNCRLCITRLPTGLNTARFIKKIWMLTDDVHKVSVYRTSTNKPKIALVHFGTHRGAAMARRRLLPEKRNICPGVEVGIDWAHPKMNVTNSIEESGYLDGKGDVIMTTSLKPHAEKKKNERIQKKNNKNMRNPEQTKAPFNGEKGKRSKNYNSKNYNAPVDDRGQPSDNTFKLFDHFMFSESLLREEVPSEDSLSPNGSLSSFHGMNPFLPFMNNSGNRAPSGYPGMNQEKLSFILNPLDCAVVRFPWYLMNSFKNEYCLPCGKIPWKHIMIVPNSL